MPKRSGFTLVELLIVISIIGILTTIGLTAFSSSQMKSRDAKRKTDLKQIATALELYFNDYGQYPVSNSGNIMGCGPLGTTVCTWGSLSVSFANSKTTYMKVLPADPSDSFNYYYNRATTSSYQIYAHLENTQDKNLLGTITYPTQCGGTCNYGVSSGNTTP